MADRPPRGRGAASNPLNRFERLEVASEEPTPDRVETLFLDDRSRTIIARNDSPDLPFDASINPYRGCEHGCIYCYARPTHEYLGFSAGLDFESRILVKRDAAELLRQELGSPRWKPQVLAISGVTDPYQPVERRLEITRACLEVLAAFGNPVMIVTKNALVTRDIDLLSKLAANGAAAVFLSITSLDPDLTRVMEPRTSRPHDRLQAIGALQDAGIPAGLLLAPIVPGLTDHEIPAVVEAAAQAGARFARYTLLRLPGAVAPLMDDWLQQHFPDRRKKVLNRVRSIRGGKLNESRFGHRMHGKGEFAAQIRGLFRTSCDRHGIPREGPQLSTASFRRDGGIQREMF